MFQGKPCGLDASHPARIRVVAAPRSPLQRKESITRGFSNLPEPTETHVRVHFMQLLIVYEFARGFHRGSERGDFASDNQTCLGY